MKPCKGSPAEKLGLAYVEGSLDETQTASFEEHFFECSACEKYVVELQRVSKQMRLNPIDATVVIRQRESDSARRWSGFLKPALAWGLPVAALLLAGVYVARTNDHLTDEAKNTPVQSPAVNAAGAKTNASPSVKPATATQTTSTVGHKLFNTAQLADLKLPVFVAPNLRDDSGDAHFVAGMKAYTDGDCRSAVESLTRVPVNSTDAHAARFFTGACQLKTGKVQAAENNLHIVVDAGDTPQLEWSLYELAQAALATNDPSTAHYYLQKTIALRGDLEAKARTEDGKVVAYLNTAQKQASSLKNK